MDVLRFLIPFLVVIVIAILFAGVIVMGRRGDKARKLSNKLMQARVLVQFVAVVIIAIVLYFSGRS